MKITVYTIKDCAFSKQEKEYLNANKLTYEEKDLETDKSFLTEMLAISNNFAGTPVTRVEKDDGTISVLKGFTKEEFDTAFGLAVSPTTPAAQTTEPGKVNDMPIATAPVSEVPSAETVSPITAPTDLPPVETPVTTTPDPLKSVMDDLQSKSQPTEPTIQPVEPAVTENPPQPVNPTADQPAAEPLPPNAPTIPDFPTK